jgi:hypothetical protein
MHPLSFFLEIRNRKSPEINSGQAKWLKEHNKRVEIASTAEVFLGFAVHSF